QQQFDKTVRNESDSAQALVAELLDRHLDAGTEAELQSFLQTTCALCGADAASLAARVWGSAQRAKPVRLAAELANILFRGLEVEKFGPGALGRVCFYLRRLESEQETRDELSRQFSLLRLFPN